MEPNPKKGTKKRGAVPNNRSTRISIPIPKNWEKPINAAVAMKDTDRSKLVREALREKLEKMGMKLPKMEAA
ncbi:hypothetical protein GCM10023213_14210 [Prosthecobacter algae]|uniref:Ribbon-helix-helix CopG family protein n=1 Tax=Prosthecobacter algae TaxID=1144682 RepID=A0ABP9NYZ4_9BACT